jgi:hypothetical protein
VPWFTSSSLRFAAIGASMKFPDITGAFTWGHGPFEPHHYLDLSWYAVHPIEVVYTIMGRGCVSVTRTSGEYGDVMVGRWADGRIGTVHAVRPYSDYGAVVIRGREVVESHPKDSAAANYRALMLEIVKFFQTGAAPVPNEETLEMWVNAMAFSPDGNWLGSANSNGSMHFWNLETGEKFTLPGEQRGGDRVHAEWTPCSDALKWNARPLGLCHSQEAPGRRARLRRCGDAFLR